MTIKSLKMILTEEQKRLLKSYQVSYRISDERTADGTRSERYNALVEKLKKLPAVFRDAHFTDAAHNATSSWIVRSLDARASDLGRKLSVGLTPGVDLLEVMPVSYTNRFELTVEKPKPASPN